MGNPGNVLLTSRICLKYFYQCMYIHFQSSKLNGLGFICGYCLRATEMGKNLASVDVRVAIGGNCTLLLYSSGDMILAVTYMK